jgi:hypothetical protein
VCATCPVSIGGTRFLCGGGEARISAGVCWLGTGKGFLEYINSERMSMSMLALTAKLCNGKSGLFIGFFLQLDA